MIRSVMVMNTEGKPQFAKFYDFQPIEKQQELIRSVYGVLCSRAENISNFVEAESIFGSDSRLVYKHFATLYFVLVFNSSENELAMLDLIQGSSNILCDGFNYKRNAYTKADLQCMNAYTKEVESCFPSDANINNVAKFLMGTVWSIKKQCKVLMISYVDDSGGLEATLGIKFIMVVGE
ncbi:AP-3 complex subunit sigma-like [Cucumis melo]|uniref:AP-3 complex subunit sigma-like n=1 Tax=Cucumis melo TaxID=3656 RepID=A0A1S3CL75_CUCME|nr:AP-3 complex subunit sigma-like [Cucumis melo]